MKPPWDNVQGRRVVRGHATRAAYPFAVEEGPQTMYAALFYPDEIFDDLRMGFISRVCSFEGMPAPLPLPLQNADQPTGFESDRVHSVYRKGNALQMRAATLGQQLIG